MGDDAARFDRHAGVALHRDSLANDEVRALEGGFHVAEAYGPASADIVHGLLVEARRGGGQSGLDRGNDVERGEVHLDLLQRVFGDGPRFGDDDRDAFADVTHAILRERKLGA